MTKPQLSVIVPTYNAERYIEEALESVVASSLSAEFVIQDAVSSDHTLELLSTRPGVRLKSEPDGGQADALNRALDRATGDLVLWLNGDDIAVPEFLEEAAAELWEDETLDCVVGDFGVIDSSGATLRTYSCREPSRDRLFRYGCYVFSGAAVWRTSALRRLRFDEDLHYCMDYDLWIRSSELLHFRHLAMVGGFLRIHPASKTGSGSIGFVREAFQVRRRYSHNWREEAWAVVAWAQALLYLKLQPIRWSSSYSRIRRHKRLGGA